MTDEVDAPPKLEPYMGDVSAIAFGIEHEYNGEFYGSDGDDGCDCGECQESRTGAYGGPSVGLPPGWSQSEEHCGWEIRTGIEHNIRQVVDEFARIERIFQTEHEDCGLHIHVNCLPTHGLAVNPVRFLENWKLYHRVIEDADPADQPDQRDTAEWCPDIHNVTIENMLGGRHAALATDQLAAFGTIEVRRGGATSDMDGFEHYLRLVLGLAHMSAFRPGETPLTAIAPYHSKVDYTGTIEAYLHKTGVSTTMILDHVRIHNQQLLAEAEAEAAW